MSAETADSADREHDVELVERAIRGFDSADPDLEPAEKETNFHFCADTDRVRFFTAEPGVGRRLLAHPAAEVDALVLADGNSRPAVTLQTLQEADNVVGVRGWLPISAVGIMAVPRETSQHAEIVSQRVFEGVDP